MEIAIRPRLDRADVEALVRDRLGGDLEFTGHEEFTDGFFNAAHGLDLADGRRIVVKVAPDKGLKLLTYEVDLMATEIECFERAIAVGVPMPRLWHGDAEHGLMIIDRLAGHSLPSVRDDIPAAERLALRREIGAMSARFALATGERFGYPRASGRTAADTWGESFLAMVGDVLDDIAGQGLVLPLPIGEVAALFAAERGLLDEVDRPALVHFDLWDGNIFVHRTGTGWGVEAFIDGERAFYGDPIAELVSLQLIPEEEFPAVVDGFLGRGLTPGEERRLALYRMYLMFILIAECGVRGFDAELTEHQTTWATETLVRELARFTA